MFGGKKETQWGYRLTPANTDHWCKDKAQAKREIARRNRKTSRTGQTAKLIQRQVPKAATTKVGAKIQGKLRNPDPCQGGSCKRNGFCRKHARQFGAESPGLYNKDGKNRNTLRWDEEGHRWG